jgi:hypothetical protein
MHVGSRLIPCIISYINFFLIADGSFLHILVCVPVPQIEYPPDANVTLIRGANQVQKAKCYPVQFLWNHIFVVPT